MDQWEVKTVPNPFLQEDQPQPLASNPAVSVAEQGRQIQDQLNTDNVDPNQRMTPVSSASDIIYGNKNEYPIKDEEIANPNQYNFDPLKGPDHGDGIIDQSILAARAMRFDYALSNKSPGIKYIYADLMNGNEQGIRNSALIDAKLESNQAKRDILSKFAEQGQNLDDNAAATMLNMYRRPNTELDPSTIMERKFANRVTYQTLALDNMRSYNYAVRDGQIVQYDDTLVGTQNYMTKQQYLKNKLDIVDDKLKNQPWIMNAESYKEWQANLGSEHPKSLGWLQDEAEYFFGMGFAETFRMGIGTQRLNYYNHIWSKTPEEFGKMVDDELSLKGDNVHMQKQFLKEMLGYSNSDAVLDNMWAIGNVALLASGFAGKRAIDKSLGGKITSDLTLLRELQRTGTKDRLVAELSAQLEAQGIKATPTPSAHGFDIGDTVSLTQLAEDGSFKTYDPGEYRIDKIFEHNGRFIGQEVSKAGKTTTFFLDNAELISKSKTNGIANLKSQSKNLATATSQHEIDPVQVLDIGSPEVAAQTQAVNIIKGLSNLADRAAATGQKESFGNFFSQFTDLMNPAGIMKGSRSLSSNQARENFIKTVFDSTNNVLNEAYINPLHINEYTQAELDSIFHQAQLEIGRRFPSINQRVLRVQHMPAETQLGKRDVYAMDIGPAPGKWFDTAEEAKAFANAHRMASAKVTRDTGGGYVGGSVRGEMGEPQILPENGKYAVRVYTTIDATRSQVRNMLGLNMSPGGIAQKAADDVTKGLTRTLRYFPNWTYNISSKKDLIAPGVSKYMDVAATTQNSIEAAAKQLWNAIDSLEGTAKLPFASLRTPREGTERNNFVRYLSNQRDAVVKGKLGRFDNTVPEFEANWLSEHGELPNDRLTTAYFSYRMLNDLDYIGLNLGIYRDKLRNAITHVRLPYRNSGSSYIAPDGTPAKSDPYLFTEPMEGKFVGKSILNDLPRNSNQPAMVRIWDSDLSQVKDKPLWEFNDGLRKDLEKSGYNQIIQVHPEQSLEAFSRSKGLVKEKMATPPYEEGMQPTPIPGIKDLTNRMQALRTKQHNPAQLEKTLDAILTDKNLPNNLTQGQPDLKQYYSNLRQYITGKYVKEDVGERGNAIVAAYKTLTGSKSNTSVNLEDFYQRYLEIASQREGGYLAGKRNSMSASAIAKGRTGFYIKTPEEFLQHIEETYGRKAGEVIDKYNMKPKVWLTSQGPEGKTLVSMSPHTPEIPTVTPVAGESMIGQRVADKRVHYILTKEQPKIEDLPFQQLPYRAGGHLQVQNDWMISQPNISRQQVNRNMFEHVFYGDKNIMSARWEADAKGYASNLEQARILYNAWKNEGVSFETTQKEIARLMPIKVDESQGRLQGSLPEKFKFESGGVPKKVPITWDDFVGMFEGKDKFLDPRLPIVHRPLNQNSMDFQNLASRTNKYTGVQEFPNLRSFTDSEHSLYKSSLNLRYATERGDHIASIQGTGGSIGSKYNPAYNVVATDYVDPLVAIKNSFSKTTRDGYLSDFKFKAAENFVQAFNRVIDKPIDMLRADPFRALSDRKWAPFTADAGTVDKQMYKTAYAYQKATNEFLNIPSDTDKWTQYMKALLKDKIYRGLGERPANWVDKIMPWDTLDGPANSIKMWTFDMSKIFDPRQIWTMGTTAFHNLAVLGPQKGISALSGGTFLSMIGRGADEATIAAYAKRAANMGYNHFDEAYRALERTGWKIVGREYSDINNYMFSPAFRDSYINQIRDAGRIFFKIGESYSRMSAWAGAFEEWRALNPTKKLMDRDIADILYRADTLNVNMTSSASASWQKGLVSIPFQFASWSARLAEQLLPGYSTRLTGQEKLQAFLTYSALYGIPVGLTGSLGVWPVHKSIAKYAMENYGDGQSNPLDANLISQVMNRGLLQTISAHTLGDYNFSEKFGSTGISPVINLIRGDKTAWASMIGPTGNLLSNYYDALSPFARWSTGIFDNTDDRFPLTPNDFTNVARTVSSANNAIKAWTAYNTGTYTSNHGVDLSHNFSPTDAVTMMLTGAIPQKVEDSFLMSESNKDLNNTQKYYKQSVIERMRLAWKAAANGDFDNATDYQKQAKTFIIAGGYTQQQYYQLYKEALQGYESMEERVHMQFIKLHPNAMKRIIDGQ